MPLSTLPSFCPPPFLALLFFYCSFPSIPFIKSNNECIKKIFEWEKSVLECVISEPNPKLDFVLLIE